MLGLLALAVDPEGPPPTAQAVGLLDVVTPYWGVFLAAFATALVLTPVMRGLATRNGIVDWPDHTRKSHVQPIAYLGGVAIFLGWLAGVAVCCVTPPHTNDLTHSGLGLINFPLSIILGAAAITFTGMFDDIYGISPRVKIGGQLFAAAALAWEDVGIRLAQSSFDLVGVTASPGLVYFLGTVLIAVFVIGGCNSLNLLDGLDGLAAGVSAIACVGFLFIVATVALRAYSPDAAGSGMSDPLRDPVRLVMCLATLGGILGFLLYNFHPASIFMGDAGSLLLGYLCVSTILLLAEVPSVGPKLVTAALIVFALPITDTLLAIVRRKMRRRPIFSPDNEHLHHLLRRAGLSIRQSVGVLYALAVAFACLGSAMVTLEWRWRTMLGVSAVFYAGVVALGYAGSKSRVPSPKSQVSS